VFTYGDEAIDEYTSYVYEVNAAYFARFGYRWTVMKPNLQPPELATTSLPPLGKEADPRWEKVLLMLSSLRLTFVNDNLLDNNSNDWLQDVSNLNMFQTPTLSLSSSSSYFVWMDADIMVVNFQSDFVRDWIEQYPTHDILISAEYHAETGVANTGCIIVKNTKWSLQFLEQWWAEDHSRGHDQILFDVVYKKLISSLGISEVYRHIQILPYNALNSVPPAYLTFSKDDNVLHLMGERHDYRTRIFGNASALLLKMVAMNESQHAVVLGLTQSYLMQTLLDIIDESIPKLLYLMNTITEKLTIESILQSSIMATNDVATLQSHFTEFRELLLQHGKIVGRLPQSVVQHVQLRRLHWLGASMHSWQQVYTMLRPTFESTSLTTFPIILTSLWIETLNTLALLGNDYLTEFCSIYSVNSLTDDQLNSVYRRYDESEQLLQQLLQWIAPSSQRLVLSMLAILWQNRASLHQVRAQTDPFASWDSVLFYQNRALDVYATLRVHASDEDEREMNQNSEVTFTEEQKSYRYRLVLLYKQIGESRCTFASAASLKSNLNVLGSSTSEVEDAYRVGLEAFVRATELWESLLLLKPFMQDIDPIDSQSPVLICQEDHFHYLQVLNHGLRCVSLAPSTLRQKPMISEFESNFLSKRMVLSKLFPALFPESSTPTETVKATPNSKKFRKKVKK
jgi:hypothetical protein